MRRNIKLAISMFMTALIVGTGMVNVFAQQSNQSANGFRISPVRAEYTVEKGKSQALTISVENPTNLTANAKIVINDFVASDKEDGEPRLILDNSGPTPKNDFRKLVGDIPAITLGPKEKKDFQVQLRVPADANAGGYYGAIRVVPTSSNDQSNVGLTASVGTIVLIKVPGNLTERLDLLQLSAAHTSNKKMTSFFTGGDVSIVTRLKNSGDIHEQPFGKIVVKDWLGNIIQTVELNNTNPKANVLPDSIRRFENDLGKRKWLGRYTVEANLGYNQGSGNLLTAKATFWYLPPWALIGLLLILVIIVGSIYLLVHRIRYPKNRHQATRR